MIAARLCGIPEFSLAALIERYFAVKVTKASQKANWAKRPLSPQMADYAVNDTRYLHRLAEILEAEMRRLGRWDWFEQSCERAIIASAVIKEARSRTGLAITGQQ
jgi:ribonuclease D